MSRPFGGIVKGSFRSSRANMLVSKMVKDGEIGMMDANDDDFDNKVYLASGI